MKAKLLLLALLPLNAAAQQNPATTNPSPATTAGSAPITAGEQKAATSPAGQVVLRLGSFNNQNLAERHLAELAMLGVQAQIDNLTVNGAPIFRVRSAPIDRNEARRLQGLLNSHNISSYMTVAE